MKPYLRKPRIEALAHEIGEKGESFLCHKTLDYRRARNGNPKVPEYAQNCAGSMILCQKIRKPTQAMQIGERLGFFDPATLDMNAPVYDSFEEMQEAQE